MQYIIQVPASIFFRSGSHHINFDDLYDQILQENGLGSLNSYIVSLHGVHPDGRSFWLEFSGENLDVIHEPSEFDEMIDTTTEFYGEGIISAEGFANLSSDGEVSGREVSELLVNHLGYSHPVSEAFYRLIYIDDEGRIHYRVWGSFEEVED